MSIRLVSSLLVVLSSGCFVSPARLAELRQDAVDQLDADDDGLAAPDDCDDSDPSVGEPRTFYADLDGDGSGDPSAAAEGCKPPEGYADRAGDCDDLDYGRSPYRGEIPDDGVDQDCNGSDTRQCLVDSDQDGWGNGITVTFAMDGSCDRTDGEAEQGWDCDDEDAGRFPTNTEIPGDGIDQDCDFADDTICFDDADGDGFGDPAMPMQAAHCSGWGVSPDGTDCDDTDGTVYPLALELCDGIVNACGEALPAAEIDGDGDGWVECDQWGVDWRGEPVFGGNDCDPNDGAISPYAMFRCDGKANACGTGLSSSEIDGDDDGFVDCAFASGVTAATWGNPEVPAVLDGGDCRDTDPTAFPGAPELCNGKADSCTPLPAMEIDNDNDGRVECMFAPGVTTASWGNVESPAVVGDRDCDDAVARSYPGASEFCDGLDNDCDGQGDQTDAAGRISLEKSDGTWADVAVDPAVRTTYTFNASTTGTLWVCPGTYYASFNLSGPNIGLVGRYGPSVTTLSGRLPPPSSTPSARILYVLTANTSIEGLTFEGGNATSGGAILFATVGHYHVTDCVFRDNDASSGGALYATNGATLAVSDTTIEDNQAYRGGALEVFNADVTFTDVTLANNMATSSGGAIHLNRGAVTLDESSVTLNVAQGAAGQGGGAISVVEGSVDIRSSELVSNDAMSNDGGAILVLPGGSPDIYLEDSLVEGNSALDWGGGIACDGPCEVVTVDTFVSGNSASQGGAVMLADPLAHFTCTATSANAGGITANYATTAGGGVQISASGATMTSNACNWGAPNTPEQNSPSDVGYQGGSRDYGTATFNCGFTGCSSTL